MGFSIAISSQATRRLFCEKGIATRSPCSIFLMVLRLRKIFLMDFLKVQYNFTGFFFTQHHPTVSPSISLHPVVVAKRYDIATDLFHSCIISKLDFMTKWSGFQTAMSPLVGCGAKYFWIQ